MRPAGPAPVVLLAALCGCSLQLGPLGLHVGSSPAEPAWSGGSAAAPAAADGTPRYAAHLARDDRTYFVLVADGVHGGRTDPGADASGTLRTADGRDVAWTCDTTDGKAGTVTVNGEAFDLAKGGLLLVSARGGRTYVRQAAVPLPRCKGGVDLDAVRAAAGDDADTARFLAPAP